MINKESLLQTFYVTDPGYRSLDKLIDACGFDYVNPDIFEKFGGISSKPRSYKLGVLIFDDVSQSAEVLEFIEKLGRSPANLLQMLLFSIDHPNFQRSIPMVALGSRWKHTANDSMVPALWGGERSRELNLCSSGTRWFAGDAFLTVTEPDI